MSFFVSKRTVQVMGALVVGALVGVGEASASPSGVAVTLADQSKISKEDATKQVEAVFAAIQTELDSGHDVTIRNFGKFYVQDRAARTGRNPRTGAEIQIPAKKYARFRSADGLKEVMNDDALSAKEDKAVKIALNSDDAESDNAGNADDSKPTSKKSKKAAAKKVKTN